jgi:hypothetical protein
MNDKTMNDKDKTCHPSLLRHPVFQVFVLLVLSVFSTHYSTVDMKAIRAENTPVFATAAISSASKTTNAFSTAPPKPGQEQEYIPLADLINTNTASKDVVACPKGTNLIEDVFFPEAITFAGRKIPRIVHVTSKSRCATQAFIRNTDNWKFPNHTFVFHDDAAVDRLLDKYWPEFPHIQFSRNCLVSGAAKADLWRYLVLYEYGGIYSDIDTGPGPQFTGEIITSKDDAWFVQEKGGFLTQYFIAASPRHPIMFFAVLSTLERLMDVDNVLEQYVPFVTGPGAMKSAGIKFMFGDPRFGKPRKGFYTGVANRTLTVYASKGMGEQFISRNAVMGFEKTK